MKDFVFKLILGAGIIYLMPYIFDGVYIKDFSVAFVVAIVLALLNKFVKPILKFFAFPINLLSFGLFNLVINGIILTLCTNILAYDFQIASFGLSILVSVCISILYSVLGINLK